MVPLEERLNAVGMTLDEYSKAVGRVGRELNELEVGILATVWSEHCSYKSSRIHLGRFPTGGPQVAQGPGENAGAVRLGGGWLAVFKMESHNHPSAIAPKEGSATGVGGIIRDVISLGAYPVAVLDVLMFPPTDFERTPWYVEGIVDGVGSYGNCVGVPNLGGQTSFYKGYEGNPLVNAMCVGIIQEEKMKKGIASGVGNRLVLVGAPTGRDGLHGATFASMELGEDAGSDLPAVQVGDPFREKLLIEAIQEILAECDIVGLQDLGAGGLTGSGAEMAGASGHGALINLETVPTRIAGLTPYEIALSESQERVLFCISPSEVPKVIRLAKKWDLRAADVGEVTSTGKIEMAWKGERVCHLPISLIEDGPKYDRPRTPLPPPPIAPSSPCPPDPVAFLNQMAARPNIARKAWVWEQYDSQVQANTVVKQGRDAGVLQVEGKRGIALSADAKPMWCLADPYWGAAHTVVEGAFNVAVRGARPLGITNCLNFGNPEKPSVMEAFSQAVDGISAASRAMDTPITGGNVSFYNESPGGAIPPTPTIGMVGVISDLDGMRGRSPQVGDQIMLLGNTEDWTLAGSEALQALVPDLPATLPPLNLEEARETLERLLVVAPHTAWLSDLSEGGLFDAFLRLLPLGMGASLSCPLDGDWLSFLFSEAPARVVFGISEGEEPPRESLSVGVVTGDDRLACSGWSAPLGPIREAWEGFFPHLIEGKLG